MEFGIEKCAMVVMEKGKIVKSVGIELPDGKVIKLLQEGESYKYLGILEADKFLEERMKLNEPESALENEDYKARRPDLVVVDKKERSCKMIDFVFPGDGRIEEKEKDKIEKYQDLGRELQKIWNVKTKIIP